MKYIAFYACNCETETFKTHEEAEKWLTECWELAVDDGYSEETMYGADYIATITHRSKFIETDKKENYHEHDDNCSEECNLEEWPHNDDFDSVGNIVLEKYTDK